MLWKKLATFVEAAALVKLALYNQDDDTDREEENVEEGMLSVCIDSARKQTKKGKISWAIIG